MSVSDRELKPGRDGSGHFKVLAGLVIGIVAGLIVNRAGIHKTLSAEAIDRIVAVVKPVGDLFLRMMQTVVLPLVFSALYLAVVDVGDLRRLGRIGLVTLGFTALLSIAAVTIGVTLVNVFQPGKAVTVESRESLMEDNRAKAEDSERKADAAKSLGQTLVDLLPENPVQEMVGAVDGSSKGNGMLAVMTFALLCGVAAALKPESTAGLTSVLRGVNEITMTIIGWALKLAPVGAGCLVFVVVTKMGPQALLALLWFVCVVLGGLLIQLLIVYPTVLRAFGRYSPWKFFGRVSEAMLVAFSTSSSSATLSTSLKVAREELKLTPETASFVLTVGATGNQNGTALFEGVVVLFLAQVFGVELSLSQQLIVVLMSVLAGVGTAGVPGGSIPLIVVVLKSVNVPAEGIGIILGVDRLLDMSRTLVNVVGDLVVATCVDARVGSLKPGQVSRS
jgi:DAACS family dicarboxylate/amino acid:cation (Na+ or H+) symporter